MKTIKEISKNIIPLTEGIFDIEGDSRLNKSIEADSTKAFLDSCKGNFSPVFFKDGSVRINGKLIISKLNTDKIYFNCKDFHGTLIIENCPKLETLEGSFLEKIAVFDGSITINQCPSLISIKGLPGLIKGSLSITNCKKLKSVDGVDSVFGNFYWSGNGKKYTQDALREKISVIKNIFCGVDEVDANVNEGFINEAFNNQWLQKLASQLKKYPYKENSYETDYKDQIKYKTVQQLFRDYGITSMRMGAGRLLDKITNEDIDVYDMSNDRDKKALSNVIYNTYSAGDSNAADIILVFDETLGEFTEAFGYVSKIRGSQKNYVIHVYIPHKGGRYNDYKFKTDEYTKTECRDALLKLGTGYTVVVINSGASTGTSADDVRKIRQDRIELQKGVIKPGDVEQYKKIAQANLKRYKDMLAQMRLKIKKDDETGGYDKLVDDYEKIQLRVMKMVRAITKDPSKFKRYEVESFLTWLKDEQRRNPNFRWGSKSQPEYFGEYGLLYYFKNFMSNYLECFGQDYFGQQSQPNQNDYKYLEGASKSFKKALDVADQKLKHFGF